VAHEAVGVAPLKSLTGRDVIMFQATAVPLSASDLAGRARESEEAVAVAPSKL
jgi:hypothetical protein